MMRPGSSVSSAGALALRFSDPTTKQPYHGREELETELKSVWMILQTFHLQRHDNTVLREGKDAWVFHLASASTGQHPSPSSQSLEDLLCHTASCLQILCVVHKRPIQLQKARKGTNLKLASVVAACMLTCVGGGVFAESSRAISLPKAALLQFLEARVQLESARGSPLSSVSNTLQGIGPLPDMW